MSKRAIILAGGKGLRLRPYTVVLPKPLMPIGEHPILEVVVRQLAYFGFDHITMAVNHQADIIRAFFGSGEKWGIQIDYVLEKDPLGTMGPLKLIKDLPDNFIVMNGDVLTDLHFGDLYNKHVASEEIFSISAHQRVQQIDYGVLRVKDNQLTGFEEKPSLPYEVSMGVYCVNKKALDYIPEGPFGFDSLMHVLLAKKISVQTIPHAGHWLDIGRPDDYARAIEEFDQNKNKFLHQ
ncbi:MAG: sugar phosphate nucleotidyltransferase [bacterium]|nr:sugar phosphate nucleotidyltransferase [bacterium]